MLKIGNLIFSLMVPIAIATIILFYVKAFIFTVIPMFVICLPMILWVAAFLIYMVAYCIKN